MGLTIHYSLRSQGTEADARSLISALHQTAHDLPFKEVDEIVELADEACDFDKREKEDPLRWLICQASQHIETKSPDRGDFHVAVAPSRLIAFSAWPGEGCEQSNIGLCQYPAEIERHGQLIPTNLSGWCWRSFCKTQYASNPDCGGVQNFLRCHLSVVALLDKARELGCLDSVSDESKFWDNRDLEHLTKEIGSWNQMIAAFGGKLKDVLGTGLESAIAEYPNFEQLEASGQNQLPPQMEELALLIKRVVQG